MRAFLAILMLAAAALGAGASTNVELRRFARLAPDAPVRIADVAIVRGLESVAIGEITLHEALSGAMPTDARTLSVDAETVRTAIDAALDAGAAEGVERARVTVSGAACRIMPMSDRPAPSPEVTDEPAPMPKTSTLRTLVAIRVAQILGVGHEDLRLTFSERDRDVLATPIRGRPVEIIATGASDTLPLSITVFEGSRTALDATIRVGVTVRRDVLVATEPMRRGARVDAARVLRETRWLPPNQTPADPGESIGLALVRSVGPGDVLGARDLQQPIAVRRGDRVLVRSVRQTVAVRAQARALGAGRIGEEIELEHLDGSGRRFRAVVDAPGRVVVAPKWEQTGNAR